MNNFEAVIVEIEKDRKTNGFLFDDISIDELKRVESYFIEKYGSDWDSWSVEVHNAHAEIVNEICARLCGVKRTDLEAAGKRLIDQAPVYEVNLTIRSQRKGGSKQ